MPIERRTYREAPHQENKADLFVVHYLDRLRANRVLRSEMLQRQVAEQVTPVCGCQMRPLLHLLNGQPHEARLSQLVRAVVILLLEEHEGQPSVLREFLAYVS